MRRAVSSVTVALGLVGVTVGFAGVAGAAPAPPTFAQAAAPGKKRCSIGDERLRELSGLVATKTGYIVINDGSDDESRNRIFFLDTKCEIARAPVRYTGAGPYDTEDLAVSPDGRTLWIADVGDNLTSTERRKRVALWSMPVGGSKQPVLHRVAYPEAKPHDAEALLINGDGRPLVITKAISGRAEVFTPAAALKSGDTEPVPMKKVGEVTLPRTTTDNVLKGPGRVAVTGAARSPDGTRVVLRTYADAFEYDVTGGDVVAALTTGKPRVTPLADPFGEAISYTPDGATFLTVSDGGDLPGDAPIDILSYPPSKKGAAPVDLAADPGKKAAAGPSWLDRLSVTDITYLIAAVGILGMLLVAAGIFGILRSRRRPPAPNLVDRRPGAAADPASPLVDEVRPGGPRNAAAGSRPGTSPGGGPATGPPPARGAGVYGAPPPAAGGRPGPGGGSVHGSDPGGGKVYGAGGGNVYGGGGGTGGGYGGAPGGAGYGGGGRAEPPRRGGPRGSRDGAETRGQGSRNRYDGGGSYGRPGGGYDQR